MDTTPSFVGRGIRSRAQSRVSASYDILEDRTQRGSRLWILRVLDEYTPESLAIWVAGSICAQTVVENLKWLFMDRGTPEHINSDNWPEFIANAPTLRLSTKSFCRNADIPV